MNHPLEMDPIYTTCMILEHSKYNTWQSTSSHNPKVLPRYDQLPLCHEAIGTYLGPSGNINFIQL